MSLSIDWKKLQNGSDIRGVALEGIEGEVVNLSNSVVEQLGKAFAHWLKQNKKRSSDLKVAVGMDSRLTGVALKAAFSEGLNSMGVDVYDCGIASTPAMFMATIDENYTIDAGVMLTASHLPFNRNGLKFFTSEGGAEKSDITDILELASQEDLPRFGDKGNVTELDYLSIYSNSLVNACLPDCMV